MCSHAITSTMRNVVRDLVKTGAEEAEAGVELRRRHKKRHRLRQWHRQC